MSGFQSVLNPLLRQAVEGRVLLLFLAAGVIILLTVFLVIKARKKK